LDPRTCALRAMYEAFQGENKDKDAAKRKPLSPQIPIAQKQDLVNYDTGSITGDCTLILDLLGKDVFVGVIDMTVPLIDIPVVKLISDFDPAHSFVSPQFMNPFYDLKK
jgi:hypothetical protein